MLYFHENFFACGALFWSLRHSLTFSYYIRYGPRPRKNSCASPCYLVHLSRGYDNSEIGERDFLKEDLGFLGIFGTFSDFLAKKNWDLGFFNEILRDFLRGLRDFFPIVIPLDIYLVNNVTDFESCRTLNCSIILARCSKTSVSSTL